MSDATGRDPRERRRLALLLALRLAAMALLVLALINPAWRHLVRSETRPHLTFLLDASPSMALSAAPGLTRRQQAEAALASAPVQRALARFDHATTNLAGGLVPEPSGAGTDLDLALRQAATAATGPIVIVSDGAQTHGDARAMAAGLRAAGRPVYTVGVGPTQPPANLGPIVIQAPRVVREKQPVPLRALIRSTDMTGAQPVQIALDGKTVATLSASLVPGATAAVKQQLPGLAAGVHLLTVTTPPRSDEATTADNTRSHLLEARRDETRLVLLAGAPDPDYAALQRLLGKLPKLQVQSFARLGPGRFLHRQGDKSDRQAPNLPRLLRDAHGVMLLNVPVSAADASALRGFVQAGGSLGWFAGKQANAGPLASLLPISPAGAYVPVLTPVAPPRGGSELAQELLRGAPVPWWRNAPFLEGLAPVRARPGADTVLPSGSGQPLLVTGGMGAGATLACAGAGTYRWLLSPEADDTSHRLYDVFWQSVVGWLSQPREQRRLVVMLDPAIAPAGQPVRLLAACDLSAAKLTAEVRGVGPKLALPLTATGPEPGRYAATLSDLPPGKYSVRVTAQAGSTTLTETRPLVIEPGGIELAEPLQHVGDLQALAAAGGGSYAPLGELASLLAKVPSAPTRATTQRATHPFRAAVALGLVALLLCGEWWLRRRWGW